MLYQITVEMPAYIKTALDAGVYELVGSVVRDVKTKTVVMWLPSASDPEMRQFVGQPQRIPGLEAVAGLQVLNTAIMVAGFAMLSMKMDGLSRQCDAILDRVGTIDHHLQWLREAGVATIQAKLHAALEGAHTAHRLGQSVLPYDTAINEAALFFRRMLGNMISRGDAAKDAEMFDVLLTQHALSVVARARSHWLLLGPAAGLDALNQGRQAHTELASAFQRALRDSESGLALALDLTADRRQRLKTTATLFGYVTHRLTERHEELASCAAIGLEAPADPETLRQLEAHNSACLVIAPVAQGESVPVPIPT
ncbi:hypothetical protein [Azospirillum sp.]|uniref:hypothetical protein n=1 Tax=Azospirillum sp. TaxID=34012 RepID=UPI003D75686F